MTLVGCWAPAAARAVFLPLCLLVAATRSHFGWQTANRRADDADDIVWLLLLLFMAGWLLCG
jgi:hypothetical protein